MLAVGLEPDLGSLAAGTVYLVLFGFVFVESALLVGFFLPGDTILFAAGLLAADPSSGLSMPVLMTGVFLAAASGDSVGYATGTRLGRPWLDRRVTGGRLNRRHLQRAEAFYERWGWWSVVAARWVPWVRTFTPVLAGVSRMSYPRFLSANVVGALAWGTGLLILGYYSATVDWLRTTALVVAGCAVAASLLLPLAARRLRRRQQPPPAKQRR